MVVEGDMENQISSQDSNLYVVGKKKLGIDVGNTGGEEQNRTKQMLPPLFTGSLSSSGVG